MGRCGEGNHNLGRFLSKLKSIFVEFLVKRSSGPRITFQVKLQRQKGNSNARMASPALAQNVLPKRKPQTDLGGCHGVLEFVLLSLGSSRVLEGEVL